MSTLLAFLLLAGVQEENPLQPLTQFAAKMEEGVNAFLKGEEVRKAFPGWRAEASRNALKSLQAAQVAGLKLFGFEMVLYFYREGKAVYRLKTLVLFAEGKPGLGELQGVATQFSGRAAELASLQGSFAPFASAAKALAGALREGNAAKVPFIDVEKYQGMIPERQLARGRKEMAGLAKRIPEISKKLQELKDTEIRIYLDDCVFFAQDAAGKTLGTFKCDWDHRKDGLELELERFRPFPKDGR